LSARSEEREREAKVGHAEKNRPRKRVNQVRLVTLMENGRGENARCWVPSHTAVD